MATTATIPVTVAPEAAARVAARGLEAPFQVLLDHTRATVPDLWAIEVTLAYLCDEPDTPPKVVLHARREQPRGDGPDATDWDWLCWMGESFPPEVCTQFTMLSWYGAPDGR